MPLVQATLATELEAMVPVNTEADGINNFATAFENYFTNSVCGGAAVTPGTLTPATTALKGAMVGVLTTGAASISAGIAAFWGVVATSAPAIWVIAPVLVSATPPPGLGGLAAAVLAAGTANIAGGLDLAAAAASMASAIHPLMLGGLGVIVTPPGGTLPIL